MPSSPPIPHVYIKILSPITLEYYIVHLLYYVVVILLLEALFIKFNRPELNNSLKASKELILFP